MNFEEALLPHLNAAHNLARWLTRNPADAQDVVQEAYLRALKFFGGFHGSEVRKHFKNKEESYEEVRYSIN